MVKGTLSNGFNYEVNERLFKDYSFLLELSRVEENPTSFTVFNSFLERLLGKEQRDAFVESFADEDNIVPIDVLGDGFVEMINDIKEKSVELKN